MVFFDVTVKNPVRVTGFELNSYAAVNSSLNLQVYSCASSYVGNETTPSAWTQIGQDNGNGSRRRPGQPLRQSRCRAPILLQAGTYGMALVSNQGHRYTNGNGSNQTYSDSFLSLQLGASASPARPSRARPITPRVWNGSIVYTPAAGIYANFTATPVEGKSPLQVQFTDTTFTNDPNGVSKWEWDFNNDQIVDSTVAEPAVHLHRRRLRREVHGQPQGHRRQQRLEHRDEEGLHHRQPVPGRERHAVRPGLDGPRRRPRPDADAGLQQYL
jgi:hypothetical protein